jgi:hypothetical protein
MIKKYNCDRNSTLRIKWQTTSEATLSLESSSCKLMMMIRKDCLSVCALSAKLIENIERMTEYDYFDVN